MATKLLTTKFLARGLIPPVFTPINADQSINYAVIPAYLQFLANKGVKSILVNGTTGEGMAQSVEERKKVAETWVNAAKPLNVHVMVQVGGAPLPDVIELAKHSEKIQVGSILSLPELYFKPRNVDELVSNLEIVAKAAPRTPVLYYHIPVNTHVQVHMPSFITAAKLKIPNFHGIKFTSNDLVEGAECLVAGNADHAVFLGAGPLILPSTTLGFDSGISPLFNFIPELAQEVLDKSVQGDIKGALVVQKKIAEIFKVLTAAGKMVPVMKVAMEIFTGIKVGPPRLPQKPLTEEQVQRIKKTLEFYKYIM